MSMGLDQRSLAIYHANSPPSNVGNRPDVLALVAPSIWRDISSIYPAPSARAYTDLSYKIFGTILHRNGRFHHAEEGSFLVA